MIINFENIIKLFIEDSYLCSIHGLQLMKYQMEKHGWDYEQWNEYFTIYRNNKNNLIIIPSPDYYKQLAEKIKTELGECIIDEGDENNPLDWWLHDVTVTDIIELLKKHHNETDQHTS